MHAHTASVVALLSGQPSGWVALWEARIPVAGTTSAAEVVASAGEAAVADLVADSAVLAAAVSVVAEPVEAGSWM